MPRNWDCDDETGGSECDTVHWDWFSGIGGKARKAREGSAHDELRSWVDSHAIQKIPEGKPSECQQGGTRALWPRAWTLEADSLDSRSTDRTVGLTFVVCWMGRGFLAISVGCGKSGKHRLNDSV